MKKYLLSQNGNFYKANLHCHTTVSDGKKTPAEIKEIYTRNDYSIVAYTDHNVMIPHPELRDENFLPMIGYELDISSHVKGGKCVHLCFVSLEDGNPKQHIFTTDSLFKGAIEYAKFVNRADDTEFERVYTPECVNKAIQIARENNFFVTYNHPAWSMEDYRDYTAYHGMHAMEICNYGCVVEGFPDYNDRVYDDMLRAGEMIYCIGTDDNHNYFEESDSHYDSCGAWTMIKADALEYSSVAKSLLNGNFYASTGPEIKALWVEEGILHIETSPARAISCIYSERKGGYVADKSANITSAEFKIAPDKTWLRVDVVDANGNHANTNAYLIADLLNN